MDNKNERHFPLIKVLTKNLFLIILVSILCALLGLGYSVMRVKPLYTASRAVMIRTTLAADNSASALSNQAALSKIYLGTISNIIKGDIIITKANENLEDSSQRISSGAVGMIYDSKSLIFKLSYTDVNDEIASVKLDAFISAVKSEISNFVQAQNVYIIETQKESDITVSSSYTTYTATGFFIGALASTLIVFLVYVFDNTIKRKEDMEDLTGVAVVAYIEKDVDKPKRTKRKK